MISLILFFGTCISNVDQCYQYERFYCVDEPDKNYEFYGYIIGDYCNRVAEYYAESERTISRQGRKIKRLRRKLGKRDGLSGNRALDDRGHGRLFSSMGSY